MSVKHVILAALLAGASFAPVAMAQTTPGDDVRVQVLQLESDVPGNVRSAPGGGRTLAPAMLYTPAKGANAYGPAIVMLNDGPGSHPLQRGQAARFAAERLAAQGYTVISLYSGQERNTPLVRFGDNKWAVKGAIDYLEHAGYEDIALLGQGYGAVLAADYLKNFNDKMMDNGQEKRVKGLILINPVLDVKGYAGFGDAKGYEARAVAMRKLVADGTGTYPKALEPGRNISGERADWVAQGDYVTPAEAWMEYWSPEAAARNAELLKDLPVPTLVMAGDRVAMSPRKTVQAMAGTHVDVQMVAGVSSDLSSAADAVINDIGKWLASKDLGVRPAVKIRNADVTTSNGQSLYGMIYEPQDGVDPEKPVIMLVHGRSADTLQSSTHWMGWRFAQAGYRVIAPSTQMSGAAGIQMKQMSDVQNDIGHWLNWASSNGAKRVVLGGHSQGGIFISNYQGNVQDKRVVGMMYFAPTADAAANMIRIDGQDIYDATNTRAEKALKAGRGRTEVIGLNTALSWYDLWGAKSKTVHSQRVGEFKLPGIAFAGGKDPIQEPAFLERFGKGYAGPYELKFYEDGSHGFRERKDELVGDAVDWLQRTFP